MFRYVVLLIFSLFSMVCTPIKADTTTYHYLRFREVTTSWPKSTTYKTFSTRGFNFIDKNLNPISWTSIPTVTRLGYNAPSSGEDESFMFDNDNSTYFATNRMPNSSNAGIATMIFYFEDGFSLNNAVGYRFMGSAQDNQPNRRLTKYLIDVSPTSNESDYINIVDYNESPTTWTVTNDGIAYQGLLTGVTPEPDDPEYVQPESNLYSTMFRPFADDSFDTKADEALNFMKENINPIDTNNQIIFSDTVVMTSADPNNFFFSNPVTLFNLYSFESSDLYFDFSENEGVKFSSDINSSYYRLGNTLSYRELYADDVEHKYEYFKSDNDINYISEIGNRAIRYDGDFYDPSLYDANVSVIYPFTKITQELYDSNNTSYCINNYDSSNSVCVPYNDLTNGYQTSMFYTSDSLSALNGVSIDYGIYDSNINYKYSATITRTIYYVRDHGEVKYNILNNNDVLPFFHNSFDYADWGENVGSLYPPIEFDPIPDSPIYNFHGFPNNGCNYPKVDGVLYPSSVLDSDSRLIFERYINSILNKSEDLLVLYRAYTLSGNTNTAGGRTSLYDYLFIPLSDNPITASTVSFADTDPDDSGETTYHDEFRIFVPSTLQNVTLVRFTSHNQEGEPYILKFDDIDVSNFEVNSEKVIAFTFAADENGDYYVVNNSKITNLEVDGRDCSYVYQRMLGYYNSQDTNSYAFYNRNDQNVSLGYYISSDFYKLSTGEVLSDVPLYYDSFTDSFYSEHDTLAQRLKNFQASFEQFSKSYRDSIGEGYSNIPSFFQSEFFTSVYLTARYVNGYIGILVTSVPVVSFMIVLPLVLLFIVILLKGGF